MEPVFSQSTHEVTPQRATGEEGRRPAKERGSLGHANDQTLAMGPRGAGVRSRSLLSYSRWAFALCVLAFGVMPRAALAGACKADGEVCRASRSCCGTNGNNGVCVIAANERFGICCTPNGAEVCDGRDNDCDGLVDGGSAHSSCDDGYDCTTDSCDSGACQNAPEDDRCDDGDACTSDSCDPTSGCDYINHAVCDDGLCDLTCGENATTCAADCIGAGSCTGFEPCLGATGQIGDNACNGFQACGSNAGDVGDNSCNGIQACLFSTGDVGNGSCNGFGVCYTNSGSVGDNSCTAQWACCANTTDIGDNQCDTFCECDGGCGGCGG